MPSSSTRPDVGSTSPAATAHRVDFPAPLAPSSATTSPRRTLTDDAVQHLHRRRIRRRCRRARASPVRPRGGCSRDLAVGRHDAELPRPGGGGLVALHRPLGLVDPTLERVGRRLLVTVQLGFGRDEVGARAFSRRFSAFLVPMMARRPSGFWARLMAPSPNSMVVKYGDVMRSCSPPVRKSLPIQLNTSCEPPPNASPASSAPPGRRIPNVTATAIHTRPMTGGALRFEMVPSFMARSAPPRPAIPADEGEDQDLGRAGRIPVARAATSLLRTASISRPGGRTHERVDHQRAETEDDQEEHEALLGVSEVVAREEREVERRPAHEPPVGAVRDALLGEDHEVGGERERERAQRQRRPRRAGAPGATTTAPEAAPTSAASTTAQNQLSWPCDAISGTSRPQS